MHLMLLVSLIVGSVLAADAAKTVCKPVVNHLVYGPGGKQRVRKNGTECLWVGSKKMNWDSAAKECQRKNGNLVLFSTHQLRQHYEEYLKKEVKAKEDQYYWVGVRQKLQQNKENRIYPRPKLEWKLMKDKSDVVDNLSYSVNHNSGLWHRKEFNNDRSKRASGQIGCGAIVMRPVTLGNKYKRIVKNLLKLDDLDCTSEQRYFCQSFAEA